MSSDRIVSFNILSVVTTSIANFGFITAPSAISSVAIVKSWMSSERIVSFKILSVVTASSATFSLVIAPSAKSAVAIVKSWMSSESIVSSNILSVVTASGPNFIFSTAASASFVVVIPKSVTRRSESTKVAPNPLVTVIEPSPSVRSLPVIVLASSCAHNTLLPVLFVCNTVLGKPGAISMVCIDLSAIFVELTEFVANLFKVIAPFTIFGVSIVPS